MSVSLGSHCTKVWHTENLSDLCHSSRAAIAVLVCEQKPYPLSFSWQRKSYPVKREQLASVKRFTQAKHREMINGKTYQNKPQVISTVITDILAKTWQFQGDKKATKFSDKSLFLSVVGILNPPE